MKKLKGKWKDKFPRFFTNNNKSKLNFITSASVPELGKLVENGEDSKSKGFNSAANLVTKTKESFVETQSVSSLNEDTNIVQLEVGESSKLDQQEVEKKVEKIEEETKEISVITLTEEAIFLETKTKSLYKLYKKINTTNMANTAQEWLTQKYSEEELGKVTELYIDEKNLKGELDLSEFTNLERIYISYFVDENELEVKDREKYENKFIKLKNAQEYLEKYLAENYPGKDKSEIIGTLYIDDKNLEGELKIEGFTNLERLDCDSNKLTSLEIVNCSKLKTLYCYSNQLKNLDLDNLPQLELFHCSGNYLDNLHFLSSLNPEKLAILHVQNNNFSEQNLIIFNKFTNLSTLSIGNDDKEKIEKGIINSFYGSLEPLKDLTKLTELNISNTNIDSGLEYLLESLGNLICEVISDDFQVSKILEQLTPYDNNISIWREWKRRGFNSEEIKQWKEAGLKTDEYDFAAYLKKQKSDDNITELETENIGNLREDFDNWIKIAQNYLDNYSPEERSKIVNLDISNKSLVGSLNLAEFYNLRNLDLANNQITELNLEDCTDLEKINCFNNEITDLNLENSSKLKELNCHSNKIKNLSIGELSELENFSCSDNLIEAFNFNFLKPEKLISLDVSNNNLSKQENVHSEEGNRDIKISIFGKFTKLQQLLIGNDDKEKIEKEQYNHFFGSLSDLKGLTNLEVLHISNTDIDEADIENLPKKLSMGEFYCSVEERPKSRVKDIQEKLHSHLTKKRLNEMYPDNSAIKLTGLYSEDLKGELDLSEYKDLEELDCHNNQLTGIDISKNTKLRKLNCSNNKLKKVELINNVNLEELILDNNKLADLSLQGLVNLVKVGCSNNELTKILNIEDCDKLNSLKYEGSKLPNTEKYYLENFLSFSQKLNELKGNWKEKEAQTWLEKEYPKDGECQGSFNSEDKNKKREQIKELDISGIGITGNLELEGFTELIYLNCSNNKLKSIDLSDCEKLEIIDCSSNKLSELTISRELKLKEFRVPNNKLNFKNIESIIGKISSTSLTYFDITDNEVTSGEISVFKKFGNLESLLIGNTVYNKKGEGNEFGGSLTDLKGLKNLRDVNICNNKIKIKAFLNEKPSSSLERIFYSFSELDQLIKESQETKTKGLEKEDNNVVDKLMECVQEIETHYRGTKVYNDRRVEIDNLWNKLSKISTSEDSKKSLRELLTNIVKNDTCNDNREELIKKVTDPSLDIEEIKKIRNEAKVKDIDNLYNYDKEVGFYKISTQDNQNSMRESDEVKAIVKLPVLDQSENELNKSEEKKEQKSYYEAGKLIYPSEEAGFSWNTGHKLEFNKLPLRLCYIKKSEDDYQIEIKRRIECIGEKNENDAKYYAILSYSWEGDANKKKPWSPENAQERLSVGGKKSLEKALETLKVLNKFHLFKKFAEIKYFWMDQMCINQDNHNEKQHEVSRMREYYGNSAVTFIAINESIGEEVISKLLKSFEKGKSGLIYPNEIVKNSLLILRKIVNSEWFSRSWTFQEGFLSKQTVFMFDDFLIDGRFMALVWKLSQFSEAYYDECTSLEELCLDKVATPVGWTYYKKGYDTNDEASLHLNEALRAVKKRKKTIPLDGIYSIVGLLPYGYKVNVDYDKDLESVLREVMLIAVESGYGDLLAWHGSGVKKAGLCWMPEIDKFSGSSNIKGSIKIKYNANKKLKFEQNKGIEIVGSEYIIYEKDNGIYKLELEETVEGGLWKREVWVSNRNGKNEKQVRLVLSGTREGVEAIGKDRILLVPDSDSWKSDKPFAMLLLGAKEDHIKRKINELRDLAAPLNEEETSELKELESQLDNSRHRIDLLRIEEGGEKLDTSRKEVFIIGIDNQPQYQSQIEINPHQK